MLKDTIQDALYELSQSTVAKVVLIGLLAASLLAGFMNISSLSEAQACVNLDEDHIDYEFVDDTCEVVHGDIAKNIFLVVGNTANSPKPSLGNDSEMSSLIQRSIVKYNSIDIEIISAATDKSTETISSKKNKSQSISEYKEISKDTINKIKNAIAKAPKANGATYFEAIVKAGRAAASANKKDNGDSKIIIIGSGLSDGGVLDFAENGLLYRTATDIVSSLNKINQLDGKYLDGVTLEWYGIGQTMEPQDSLSPADIQNLQQIYGKVFQELGAEIDFYDNVLPSETIEGNTHTVKTTPIKKVIPEPEPIPHDELSFKANSTTIQNINQAKQSLEEHGIIKNATANPNLKIVVTGYMAAGTCDPKNPNNYHLSGERAEAVKNLLLNEYSLTNEIVVVDGGVFDSETSECANGHWQSDLADYRRKVVISWK